jgi:hypothetical protein
MAAVLPGLATAAETTDDKAVGNQVDAMSRDGKARTFS